MMVFMLTDDQKNRIIQYVQDKPIELVYLFGSQETGRAGPLSDYDFAVLFHDALSSSQRFDLKLHLIGALVAIVKNDHVDVVDLVDAPLDMAYSAIFPKELVFARTAGKAALFEAPVVKRYLDIAPVLHQIAKRQIELIAEQGFRHGTR